MPNPNSPKSSRGFPQGFPQAFGNYILLAPFTKGGMGEIYLAKSFGGIGIDRLCVVKKIRRDLQEDAQNVSRFLDEARLAINLTHASICQVFDVGCIEKEYYIAMEYVPGNNLRRIRDRLKYKGIHFSPELAVHMICQVLDGLSYAHRAKDSATGRLLHLVHRDISPQNLMLNFEGEVKIIDFGLALSDIKVAETKSEVVMGKVTYMSPEQARGDDVDHSTDQFATAVILCELLTGNPYYGDRKTHAIWQIVGRGNFLPDDFPSIPAVLQPILKKSLSSFPDERYADCEEMREVLIEASAHFPRAQKSAFRALLEDHLSDEHARDIEMRSRAAEINSASLVKSGFAIEEDEKSALGHIARQPTETAMHTPSAISAAKRKAGAEKSQSIDNDESEYETKMDGISPKSGRKKSGIEQRLSSNGGAQSLPMESSQVVAPRRYGVRISLVIVAILGAGLWLSWIFVSAETMPATAGAEQATATTSKDVADGYMVEIGRDSDLSQIAYPGTQPASDTMLETKLVAPEAPATGHPATGHPATGHPATGHPATRAQIGSSRETNQENDSVDVETEPSQPVQVKTKVQKRAEVPSEELVPSASKELEALEACSKPCAKILLKRSNLRELAQQKRANTLDGSQRKILDRCLAKCR
jgi:serine/threonine protein kinase